MSSEAIGRVRQINAANDFNYSDPHALSRIHQGDLDKFEVPVLTRMKQSGYNVFALRSQNLQGSIFSKSPRYNLDEVLARTLSYTLGDTQFGK